MEEKNEKYLPLGTICLLNGGKKYVMVTGYLGVSKQDVEKVYDYIGVVFPIGVISNEVTFMFNHDQIGQVVYKGFENDESKEFISKIKGITKESIIAKMKGLESEDTIMQSESAEPLANEPEIIDMNKENSSDQGVSSFIN